MSVEESSFLQPAMLLTLLGSEALITFAGVKVSFFV
jgi:hypothetical protein